MWGTHYRNVAFRRRGCGFDLLVGVSVKPGVSQCSRSVWERSGQLSGTRSGAAGKDCSSGTEPCLCPAGIHSKYSGPVFAMTSVLSADGSHFGSWVLGLNILILVIFIGS